MKVLLSGADRKALACLSATRDRNFRLLEYYSRYLNFCPDAITKEDMEKIGDGLLPEYAFFGILCAVLGLDAEASEEDKVFARRFLLPSIKRLDPALYRADPYYQNIHIPNTVYKNWELKHETYPPYRAFIYDDLTVDSDFRELPPLGFFEEPFHFPAVLEDGREWMLITPNEIETAKEAVAAARGSVITFGLGLGYYAYMASEKSEVRKVTVIERDEKVIRLFSEFILPQFAQKEKIRIIHADAFDFAEHQMQRERFDIAFVDTWHDASDGVDMYLKMKKLEKFSPDTEFYYWIEKTLLSYLRWLVFTEIEKGDTGDLLLPAGKRIESFDRIRELLSDDSLRNLALHIQPISPRT